MIGMSALNVRVAFALVVPPKAFDRVIDVTTPSVPFVIVVTVVPATSVAVPAAIATVGPTFTKSKAPVEGAETEAEAPTALTPVTTVEWEVSFSRKRQYFFACQS